MRRQSLFQIFGDGHESAACRLGVACFYLAEVVVGPDLRPFQSSNLRVPQPYKCSNRQEGNQCRFGMFQDSRHFLRRENLDGAFILLGDGHRFDLRRAFGDLPARFREVEQSGDGAPVIVPRTPRQPDGPEEVLNLGGGDHRDGHFAGLSESTQANIHQARGSSA